MLYKFEMRQLIVYFCFNDKKGRHIVYSIDVRNYINRLCP